MNEHDDAYEPSLEDIEDAEFQQSAEVDMVDQVTSDDSTAEIADENDLAEAQRQRYDREFEEITKSFHADPSLNHAGVRYTTSTAVLCEQVTDGYLAPSKLAKLRTTPPRIVADGLLGRINDQIAKQNALVKADQLVGVKRAPLSRLGFTEVARLMGALYSVVSIAPSKRNSDPDMNILAAYDDDKNSPHFGTYRSEVGHLRAVARRYRSDLSVKEFADILASLSDYAPRVVRGEDQDMIAVKNGIVDYNGGKPKFRPFSPEHVFLAKLEVNWNPDAQNPVIPNPEGCIAGHEDPADCSDECLTWDVESWMSTLSSDPEVVELLWQIIGAVARPYVSWNKAAFFFSTRGNNGKGTLLGLMRNMLGTSNYASIPLADFGKDFLLEPLTRANAVLVDENDVGTFVDRAANFKAVVTNDVITINRKYKAPIAHQHFGFMVQCINDQPQFKDRSESIYRRQLFIPFTKSFTGIERKYIKDVYLKRPDVLEYVLKRVLEMSYYELSEPETVLKALDEFKESNDPVRAFWNEKKGEFAWDLLPFQFLYDLFKSWMGRNMPNSKPVGKQKFTNELLALLEADPNGEWTCEDRQAPHRPTTRMSAPELLISEFGLSDWMNLNAKPSEVLRQSTIPTDRLKASYRGLLRRQDPAMSEVIAAAEVEVGEKAEAKTKNETKSAAADLAAPTSVPQGPRAETSRAATRPKTSTTRPAAPTGKGKEPASDQSPVAGSASADPGNRIENPQAPWDLPRDQDTAPDHLNDPFS